MAKQEESSKASGRVLLPSHVVPQRYDLNITPNLESFTFTGTVEITYAVDAGKLSEGRNSTEITLHAKELCFIHAEYIVDDVANQPVPCTSFLVDLEATTVKFVFKEAIPSTAKSIRLKIEYSGFLNNQMAGFYRSSYTDINGKSKIMASTQFESLDARRAFPCVDEPAAKAIFGLTMTIPSDLTVFSNMPESTVLSLDSNRKTVSFLDTPLMSTYLLAFCVGEFDFLQAQTSHGVMIKVYTPPGKSESGKFALQTATRALDAYDDFFQVPYPLPKLDMVRTYSCYFFVCYILYSLTQLTHVTLSLGGDS